MNKILIGVSEKLVDCGQDEKSCLQTFWQCCHHVGIECKIGMEH